MDSNSSPINPSPAPAPLAGQPVTAPTVEQQSLANYKNLIGDIIKKQLVILGPDIALAKARSVSGLTLDDNGTVSNISGDPADVLQSLIDAYVSLSGLIIKKTMEPLLSKYPNIRVPQMQQ